MVKSMKKVKRIIAVALVFTMLFASQVTAFAADTKATKSANKDMSIALMPGVTGVPIQLLLILAVCRIMRL